MVIPTDAVHYMKKYRKNALQDRHPNYDGIFCVTELCCCLSQFIIKKSQ